jgi:hypothetical protein
LNSIVVYVFVFIFIFLRVVALKAYLLDVLLLYQHVVLVGVYKEVVLLETALVQVLLVAALENAFKGVSSGVVLVNLHVLLQIRSRSKLLLTHRTFERLLSSMNSLMPNQVRDLAEENGASRERALVGLELVVHSCVLLETGILSELLVALRAIRHTS